MLLLLHVEEIPIVGAAAHWRRRRRRRSRRSSRCTKKWHGADQRRRGEEARRDSWQYCPRHRRQDARQRWQIGAGAPCCRLLDGGGRVLLLGPSILLLEVERERRLRRHLRQERGVVRLRLRRCGGRGAGEALHDGHEVGGVGVDDLGRHGVDDDRLPELLHRLLLPDLVRLLADLERRRPWTLQLPPAATLRRRRRGQLLLHDDLSLRFFGWLKGSSRPAGDARSCTELVFSSIGIAAAACLPESKLSSRPRW